MCVCERERGGGGPGGGWRLVYSLGQGRLTCSYFLTWLGKGGWPCSWILLSQILTAVCACNQMQTPEAPRACALAPAAAPTPP